MENITITINGYKITIEKEEEIKTAPVIQPQIQYNEINIKRKYYKKTDPEYKRKQVPGSIYKTNSILKSSEHHNFVKQEPLLDLHY